ncbi:FecR family protein [Duganella sp. CF517]|uniref:FecR family protein n=1 Tax=Duganella sp. CF517 TaxID=1881038 RepID=UPI0008ACE7BA|nr:FecR domain-containing protein [Duganella sp. CF517]SEN10156.1 FecR family protein [Duganella sp. CF517]
MSIIDQQAMDWLVRQSERRLGAAERAEFDAWYAADIRHQGAFLRATAIDNALSRATVQQSLRPGRERLRLEWAGASWHRTQPRRAWLALGAMAAGVAVFGVGALFHAAPAGQLYATAKGEFRKVPLADRSVASINSDSRVEVDFGGRTRKVALLHGEAWFEVAKDKSRPFVVDAGNATVRAVGTAFAVRRRDGGADVAVTEGTVEIVSGPVRQLLTAGQSAAVNARGGAIAVSRRPDEIASRLAWREGKLVFVNQTLSDAVADFNRYSAKQIVIGDPRLGGKTLVGQYQIDAPELFARDVGAFLAVPVLVTADRIVIGEAPRARR